MTTGENDKALGASEENIEENVPDIRTESKEQNVNIYKSERQLRKEEKKRLKAEKKKIKEEKRRLHPGPVRRSVNLIKNETSEIKNMYQNMKDVSDLSEAASDKSADESFDAPENIEETGHISHVRGKFKILVRPSLSDYFNFMLRYELSSISGFFSVIVSAASVILLIIAIITGSSFETILIILMIIFLLMLVGPFSYFIKALKLSGISSDPNNTKEYCFSSKGFDISSKNKEYIAFLWEDVYSVRETEKTFYIFIGPDDGMIIPKKDIEASGRKSEQFSELLYKKCADKMNIRKFL